MQPLEGIRILDLSRVYAGPGGTMILGDLGAEVIRVESPEGTDSMRDWVPFIEGESTYYLCANRNKQSITLNLKDPEGKELFLNMIKKADVILENFKTGTLERMSLGYEVLKSIKPDLILCSVTGYGHTGPYKNEPGFDPVIQAIGGLMDVTGSPEGEPTRVGLPVIDIMTSQYVAISILSAIRLRDLTGKGQKIEISLLDVQLSSLANVASSYLNTGKVSKRIGNGHSYIVPYQVFQCSDRPLMVSAGNERLFKQLCIALNHPEWAEDERYVTNERRVENREELTKKIQAVFYEKTADQWFDVFSKSGVPSGPVNNIEQVFEHPQVIAREAVEEISHPTLGTVKLVKSPIRFSTLQVQTKTHPPLLGEHTEQYLETEIGLEKEEIARLKERGVI
ncbi:CaiB/BaiF CoA transferase family protein [Cytobacillus purgationiresistens]|uniref:Crotonobetainyl-CoA:carnitine CoA-transferase CaiB-like acyl-CoA transferase n=1 Tax=Cytobacillus purgationiresistens TaxID=863449 RepID=A0ABU0AEK7_9BACI|nr:CaiB/BaiF CoA-transferase family protein [Cytobacillus purgationiresistens]MDQ0269687.1 crotonobetainyl-CoA:carnitine CoA-transferase CaiB-like acyl-CoA transferase [Cytobacillus purgationiresistens]